LLTGSAFSRSNWVSYVSNAELSRLSISSWCRVILAFVLLLGFGSLIPHELGWIALPLFLALRRLCRLVAGGRRFSTWLQSVVSAMNHSIIRAAGGVFPEPMSTRAVLFARFIIGEAHSPLATIQLAIQAACHTQPAGRNRPHYSYLGFGRTMAASGPKPSSSHIHQARAKPRYSRNFSVK
jgi:hypothetical protein